MKPKRATLIAILESRRDRVYRQQHFNAADKDANFFLELDHGDHLEVIEVCSELKDSIAAEITKYHPSEASVEVEISGEGICEIEVDSILVSFAKSLSMSQVSREGSIYSVRLPRELVDFYSAPVILSNLWLSSPLSQEHWIQIGFDEGELSLDVSQEVILSNSELILSKESLWTAEQSNQTIEELADTISTQTTASNFIFQYESMDGSSYLKVVENSSGFVFARILLLTPPDVLNISQVTSTSIFQRNRSDNGAVAFDIQLDNSPVSPKAETEMEEFLQNAGLQCEMDLGTSTLSGAAHFRGSTGSIICLVDNPKR